MSWMSSVSILDKNDCYKFDCTHYSIKIPFRSKSLWTNLIWLIRFPQFCWHHPVFFFLAFIKSGTSTQQTHWKNIVPWTYHLMDANHSQHMQGNFREWFFSVCTCFYNACLNFSQLLYSSPGKFKGELFTTSNLPTILFVAKAQARIQYKDERCHLTNIGNPVVRIRWSYDHLISTLDFLYW